jgi:hypothetical protein
MRISRMRCSLREIGKIDSLPHWEMNDLEGKGRGSFGPNDDETKARSFTGNGHDIWFAFSGSLFGLPIEISSE